MKQVIIMRGIVGAGKSTYAKLFPDAIICSADEYHIDEDGIYRFDPANIGKAHDYCLSKFLFAIQDEDIDRIIIVDNTNLSIYEIAPYYRLAQIHNLDVKIIRIHTDFEIAARRNIHSVPLERIWQMYQTLLSERLPFHWKEEIVFGGQEGSTHSSYRL